MRILLRSAFALAAAALPAQSPLTTMFASNNGGNAGGGVYFDLTIRVPVTISRLDLSLTTTAAGSADFFVLPGLSHVGFETSAAQWVLAGTGPVTGLGLDIPSPCTFATPVQLSPGRYGVAIRYNGVAARYTNGTGTNQTFATTEMTLTAGSAGNIAFGTAVPFSPRIFNGSIHYTVGGASSYASWTPFGAGCVAESVSFYEDFPANSFDLANRSMLLTPLGSGYLVSPGSTSFFTHTVPGLALTDDVVAPPQTLPFTLQYPGGSTNTIWICSNGFVYLTANTAAPATGSPAALMTGGPRLSPYWMDLLPDGVTNTANVFYEVDPTTQTAYVTWLNVPQFNQPGTSNTVQIAIRAADIEFRYRNCANAASTTLVGFSPGASNRDPGTRDLTATWPFVTRPDVFPLTLASNARPRLGSTIVLQTTRVPTGALGAALMLGATALQPALDLTAIGMPTCFLHTTPLLQLPVTVSGNSAPFTLPIANNPTFTGVPLFFQSVAVHPSSTPLGVLASNGLEVRFGPN